MTMGTVAKDSSFVLLARLMISFSNLLFIPLLTKNLSTENYGIWAQVWITLPLVSSFLLLGFDEAMSRFFPSLGKREYSRDFFSLLLPIVLLGSVSCAVIYFFSDPISNSLFNGNAYIVELLSALIFIFLLDLIFYSLLRSLRLMRTYSILIFVQNIFEMGMAAMMVMMGEGVEGAVLAILITRLGILFSLILISRRLICLSIPSSSVLGKYILYGLPTLPMVVSRWVLASFDRYMIALFFSTREVGFYDPAYTLGQSIPLIIAGVISFTLTPHLSKMFDSKELVEVRKTLSFMTKLALAINIPFILGGIVLSRPVLELFSTGPIATNAYAVLPMISVGVTFLCLMVILGQIWNLEKKTYKLGIAYTSSAVINIILNYFLIPHYGINGAAMATMIAYGIGLLITSFWIRRDLFPRVSKSNILKIILSSILMFIAVYISHSYLNTASTIIPIIIGIMVYLISIRHLGILDEEEKKVLKDSNFLSMLS